MAEPVARHTESFATLMGHGCEHGHQNTSAQQCSKHNTSHAHNLWRYKTQHASPQPNHKTLAHKTVSYTYAGAQQPKNVHETQHGHLPSQHCATSNGSGDARSAENMQYNYKHTRQAGRWAKALTSGKVMEHGGCCTL
jgi:hypothetical protein